MEILDLAGALDSVGYRLRGLLESYDRVAGPLLAERRAEAAGQFSLFGGGGSSTEVDESVLQGEEFEKAQLLAYEKQMLGQYVSDHPLLAVRERLARLSDMEISELPSLGDGDLVTIGGIIGALARRFTKKGDAYALFRLEDLAGGVQIVAFPGVFQDAEHLLAPDRIVVVKGRIDLRGRELQVVANEIGELVEGDGEAPPPANGSVNGDGGPLTLSVSTGECTNGLVARLKETLAAHPGQTPVVLKLVSEDHDRVMKLADGYRVDGSAGLLAELRTLLGSGSVG